MRIRHLIPAGFVIYLLTLPLLWYFTGLLAFLPLTIYFLLDLLFSIRVIKSSRDGFHRLLIYPTLHISYGTGFLLGLGKKDLNTVTK